MRDELRVREFGLKCNKISDPTTGYLQTRNKNNPKLRFSQNDSSFIFNENDANYWVLTQDEFLFDELHTALQKTYQIISNTRKCGVMQHIGGKRVSEKIIATKIFSVSLFPS